MKITAIISFLCLSLTAMSQKNALSDLKNSIQNRLGKEVGEFAVAFKNLQNGDTVFINGKTNFHAASTMKTPVMIELFKQAKAGKFKLSDSVLIKNEFKSIADSSLYSLDSTDDSANEMYKLIGTKMTIYDLNYQMITLSSNLATNLLIDLVGAKNVAQTMRELGANDIRVLRGVEDNKAYQLGLNNSTTAYDLALIFEKMAHHKLVSKKASKEMIKVLLDQHFNELIPGLLPAEVTVAHKTGFIKGLQHDGGIVFLPGGRKYVLVLLSHKLTDEPSAIKAMAEVSRMVYDFVMHPDK